MTIYVVVSTEIDGTQHGVAAQVPDGWLDDPTKAETLCYSAMQMFITHCREQKLALKIGHDVAFHLEEH